MNAANMITATVKIGGMTCSGCVRSVTQVLQALPGVEAVDVSLDRNEAQVRYDPTHVEPDAFRRVVEGAGFEVR
jgi:copper chaperone